MSAFIVSKEHIDVLLAAGLHSKYGHCLTWYDRPPEQGGAELHELSFVNVDEIGQMLVSENVQSVRARYPDIDHGGIAPGPAVEYWREPYTYANPGFDPTPVETLKALGCFEYQSCEHEGWETSEALRFCEALRADAIERLDGMETAPWGWDAETVAARRQEALAH